MREHWLDKHERETEAREDERTEATMPARSFTEPDNPLASYSTAQLIAELARRFPWSEQHGT